MISYDGQRFIDKAIKTILVTIKNKEVLVKREILRNEGTLEIYFSSQHNKNF